MYCTTPSGTRYQTGSPLRGPGAALGGRDRQRRDLDDRHPVGRQARSVARSIACRAGCSRRSGRARRPRSASCQVRIWASASAPVMKKSSASGRSVGAGRAGCRSCTSGRRGRCRHATPRTAGWTPSRSPSSGSGPRPARPPGPTSATAARSGRRRPRRGRTTPAPPTRRPGDRGGSGRTCRPSRRPEGDGPSPAVRPALAKHQDRNDGDHKDGENDNAVHDWRRGQVAGLLLGGERRVDRHGKRLAAPCPKRGARAVRPRRSRGSQLLNR